MSTKQRNVRLTSDLSDALEAAARRYGLDENDIMRRALRYYIRALAKDKEIILSKESSEPLDPSLSAL